MELIYIGIALYLLYSVAESQYDAIDYNLKSVDVVKWGYDGVTVEFNLDLKNGSDIPIFIDGFIGVMEAINGTKIADVGLIKPVKSNPGSDTVVKLGAKISYAGAANAIFEFFNSEYKNSKVKIKGTLLAGTTQIPINFNTELW